MKNSTFVTMATLMAAMFMPSVMFAQDPDPAAEEQFVTWEELDEILGDYDAALDGFEGQYALLDSNRPGAKNFLLTGFMSINYTDTVDGASAFNGGFSPIFLWRLREDLLIEAELETGLGEGEVGLEYLQMLYVVNSYLTVGIGKFLSPLGQFTERYHPSWINKLPNAPLYAGHEGLIPGSLVGAQVRGGIRSGSAQWKYVVFVANGPQEAGHAGDPGEPEFAFEADGTDLSQNKAIGGRISFLPVHWFELGVSTYSGKTSDATGSNAGDLSLYVFDFAAHDDTPVGYLRVDGEAVTATLDNGGSEDWTGGYVQAALRPKFGGAPSDFEGVLRYDWLGFPTGIPSALEPTRMTAGLNFWLDESTVIKLAIETLDVDGETQNSILLQAAIGF